MTGSQISRLTRLAVPICAAVNSRAMAGRAITGSDLIHGLFRAASRNSDPQVNITPESSITGAG